MKDCRCAWVRVYVCAVALFIQAACAPTVDPTQPGPTAHQTRTNTVPTAFATSLPGATSLPPTASATSVSATSPPSTQTLKDETLGITLSYPRDWQPLQRAPDASGGVTLRGPAVGEGPEPIIFAISVDEVPTTEQTIKAAVEHELATVPADARSRIQRLTLTVGGEPAEQLIGMPSQAGDIETFVLHRGRLYVIILQPFDPGNQSLTPYLDQVRAAYDQVLNSFKFLE